MTALSTAIFIAGCAHDDRMGAAARAGAEAGLVGQAIAATSGLPELPPDCRLAERSGVDEGDRLDVALVKTDAALGRANARVGRCARWYADLDGQGAD